MAYTPTQWVNGQPPALNADNLNKIEQGIAEASNEVDQTAERIAELNESKLDKGGSEIVDGINEEAFKVFSTYWSKQTKIIDGEEKTAFVQSPMTDAYTWSAMKPENKEVYFKWGYNVPAFVLCANESACLAVQPNLTASNVYLHTKTGRTLKPGIIINENIRRVTTKDAVKYVKSGNKIAYYVLINGAYEPIFRDEWVDIAVEYSALSSDFNFSEDISFGVCCTNSFRNEAVVYDCTIVSTIPREYATKEEYDTLKAEVDAIPHANPNEVDLFMFMGQSNMAGRGTASQAPEVDSNKGHEFRAISDPTKLYQIAEPFGYSENKTGGINDSYAGTPAKSGSMVSAFVNEYYKHTNVPVVGVSASEGGTRIGNWLPTPIPATADNRYNDAKNRYEAAVAWLNANGYAIRHKYILWCQGESDGDDNTTPADYATRFATMASAWLSNGIEKIFIVRIGNNRDDATLYDAIMQAQNEIGQTEKNVVMVSTQFAEMAARGLMKDAFHYQQVAYNEVGANAAKNTAFYVNTGKEPTMWDPELENLYYSHKND